MSAAARTLTAIVLVAAVLPQAIRAETVEGAARVVDGDTIEIDETRIRLWGIDAPELAQRCSEDGTPYPCGLDAAQALRKQIGRKSVRCVRGDTDRYGRMVGLCSLDGIDVSRWMVQQGQAIAFRRYSLDYVADEDAARAAKVGLWAGEFQDPSEFRHQNRRAPSDAHTARRACACPDDRDRAGRRCGRRSGHLRPGGQTSACSVAR